MPKKNNRVNIGKTVRVILTDSNLLHPILAELIRFANKDTNEIVLNKELKARIVKGVKLKVTIRNIETYLIHFMQQNHLIRIAESTYMLNPRTAFDNNNFAFMLLEKRFSDLKIKAEKERIRLLQAKNKVLKEEVKFIEVGKKIINNVNEILNNSKPFEDKRND